MLTKWVHPFESHRYILDMWFIGVYSYSNNRERKPFLDTAQKRIAKSGLPRAVNKPESLQLKIDL